MSYTKQCVVCGKIFETNHPKIITCGKECSLENRKRKEKEYRQKTDAEKGKKLYNKICRICGKEFETTKSCQTICSSECRLKAERERQARYERRKREGLIPQKKKEAYHDSRYDWLRKFDTIVKQAIKDGTSYGKVVAKGNDK